MLYLIFKECHSEQKKNYHCKNNCIKPIELVNKSINDIIVEVYKNGEEIWPPSKGHLDTIGNFLFCKKKRSVREKDILTSCHGPSAVAVVVHIPKRKKGWQCFLIKKEEIQSITHSLFESILGLYVLRINDNKNKYLIKIGKGGKNYLSNKLDILMENISLHRSTLET